MEPKGADYRPITYITEDNKKDKDYETESQHYQTYGKGERVKTGTQSEELINI
jgi:hypothetical protein